MPYAQVRGVTIRYEVVGTSGPWVALSTGGRSGYAEFVPLARKIAGAGFRVLLHDRRNCGASEVALDDSQSEDAHRVDDLHELLLQQDAVPAFVGGSSSGARMSLLYCLRHPSRVRGLLLMRVTGGAYPAAQLPENYYGQFIRAAGQGGMDAVCAMDHWKACIAARPENRAKLASAERFIAVMSRTTAPSYRADAPVRSAIRPRRRSRRLPDRTNAPIDRPSRPRSRLPYPPT